jgi:UDP-N-acetylmuramate dehydrogenase
MTAKHATPVQKLLVDPAFDAEIYANEPMSRHTTYKIGGPARFLVRVDSMGALAHLVEVCKDNGIAWVVVGRGSNLLVSDDGFDGVIIVLGRDFRQSRLLDNQTTLVAGAGANLSGLVQKAFRAGLAGLEFAVGVPGSFGGALFMNAGSRDEWIGESVTNVTVLNPQGTFTKINGEGVDWGYRSTSFSPQDVIIEAELALTKTDPFYIRGKMEASLSKRKKSQPLDLPNCGSVFKNPPGESVGRLIEECGLKGTTIGNAQISTMHANFIVNKGGATAADVRALIELARTRVADQFGIELACEVKFLGF